MSARIYGGINTAMKVPPHQYEAAIAFCRDVVGLKPSRTKLPRLPSESLWPLMLRSSRGLPRTTQQRVLSLWERA